ncbi:MAG: 4-hydroxy-tetrahydrodipicolinate synthase [Eubacterium sp.]|nr:4-hydroxy-tetrahydrodipicolinate synthase [Eubacterium sp.]
MSIFKGSGVAIVTPFDKDDNVDFDELQRLIDWHCDNGTDAIVIVGTTGEGSTLTMEEHAECIRQAVAMAKKRVPVIAGTGSNCTADAVVLSKEADSFGADAVLVVTPYYNKATQKGLKVHYTEVAKSINVPVIVYNVPSRTGCKVNADTAAELIKEVDNIVGMKDATGDITYAADLMHYTNGDCELYSGNDDMVVPMLSIGGIGVISVLANVAPRQTHEMVASFLNGDVKKASEIQLKAMPLIHALFSEVNPIPVKHAVNAMGFNAGHLRAPLTEIEEANGRKLIEEMKKFGIEVK